MEIYLSKLNKALQRDRSGLSHGREPLSGICVVDFKVGFMNIYEVWGSHGVKWPFILPSSWWTASFKTFPPIVLYKNPQCVRVPSRGSHNSNDNIMNVGTFESVSE